TGPMTMSFTVPVLDDCLAESDETILLTLSNPTGGAVLGTINTAVLTILDNGPERPGSLDHGYTNLTSLGSTMLTLPNGKVLLGGSGISPGGGSCVGVVRLNANGSIDTSFSACSLLSNLWNRTSALAVTALAVQPDGKVLVGGYATGI